MPVIYFVALSLIALWISAAPLTAERALFSSEDLGVSFNERVYYTRDLRALSRPVAPRLIRYMDVDGTILGKTGMVEGVLFSYAAPDARAVALALASREFRPQSMVRNAFGVWVTVVPPESEFRPGRTNLRYKFLVDGIWDHDRANPDKTPDGYGGYVSRLRLAETPVDRQATARALPEHIGRRAGTRLVEFRLYRPQASSVILIGSFNRWNPDHDMLRRDAQGVWRLRKYLEPGDHLYRFLVDGRPELDQYNSRIMLDPVTDDRASHLVLK